MTERPPLSKGELDVARLLWKLGEETVRQVHEQFPAGRKIDFATVQTSLRRLEAKGYVRTRLQGHSRVYSAKIKPRTVIRDTVDDLIDRLFGGEALPLMRHLIEERGISDNEVRELRRLIDRLEEESSDELCWCLRQR